MIMLIPIFSQKEIISQSKMGLAFMLALFMTPLVLNHLPESINQGMLFTHLFKEFFIGVFIGLSGRVLFVALDMVGHIIGVESGLSNAMIFNPSTHTQGSLPSVLLSVSASVLLFQLEFHHVLIKAIAESYTVINSDNLIFDSKTHLVNVVQKMFSLGLQFSYPFLIVGIIINLSLGLLNKIIPQIQLFSVIMPAQVIVGLLILSFTIAGILRGFTGVFIDAFLRG